MDSADHVPQRPPRRIARGAGVRAIDHGRSASALRAGWSSLLGALVTTWLLIKRVAVKSWTEGIVGRSGQAAFWQTLSLPPLLMGLLGALGYVSGWFGPQTLEVVRRKIITASNQVFSDSVVEQIISPTIDDMLARGRGSIVSVGFVLSFWAGSSAISCFVDAIVEAHGQKNHRHPVWQRIVALGLYLLFLALSVVTLPLVALGPTMIGDMLPDHWHSIGVRLVDYLYYPAVGLLLLIGLTMLYKLALPKSLPWHRLIGGAVLAGAVFIAASAGLRVYLANLTKTGYSYGALATPIAFLLFTFFLGLAIVLGAQFNATVQEFWPARETRMRQVRRWFSEQTRGLEIAGARGLLPLGRSGSTTATAADGVPAGTEPADETDPGTGSPAGEAAADSGRADAAAPAPGAGAAEQNGSPVHTAPSDQLPGGRLS